MEESEGTDRQEGTASEFKQSLPNKNKIAEKDSKKKKCHDQNAGESKQNVSDNNESVEKDNEKKHNQADSAAELEQSVSDNNETMENKNEIVERKEKATKTENVVNVSHEKKSDATIPNKVDPANVPLQLVLLPTKTGGSVQYTPVFVRPDQMPANLNSVQTSSSQSATQTALSQSQANNTTSVTNKTDISVTDRKAGDSRPQSQPILILPKGAQSQKPIIIPRMNNNQPGTKVATPALQSGKQNSPLDKEVNTFNQYLVVTDTAKATHDGTSNSKTQSSSGTSKVTGVILQDKATGALYINDSVQQENGTLLNKMLENADVRTGKRFWGKTKTGQSQKHTSRNKTIKPKESNVGAMLDHEKLVKASPKKKQNEPLKTKSQYEVPKVDSTNMNAFILQQNNQLPEKSLSKNQGSLPAMKQDNIAKKKPEPIFSNIEDNVSIMKQSNEVMMQPDLLFAFPKTEAPTPGDKCICCGKRVPLIDMNTEDMHQKGFPDILYRYGGITANEKYDKVCQPCMNAVIRIEILLVKFFEKCQKTAKKRKAKVVPLTHLRNVLKADKSTNTEFAALVSLPFAEQPVQTQNNNCRNQTNHEYSVPGKISLPKLTVPETATNNVSTLFPGQFVVPAGPYNLYGQIKKSLNAKILQPAKISQPKILPKPGGTVSIPIQVKARNPKTKIPIETLIQHETVAIDHDYDQSVPDKQRTDLIKKVNLEQLKVKLYMDEGVKGDLAPNYTLVKCCGKHVEVGELASKLLSFEEAVSQFQSQELKKISETSKGLMARKLGNTSDLVKGKKEDENLLTYDFTKLYFEFCDNFPLVSKIFLAIANVPAEKLEHFIPHFGMIYASLMRMRSTGLNRVHRLVSRCLLENMVPKRVHKQLAHIGVTLSYEFALTLQSDKNFKLTYPVGILDQSNGRRVPEGSNRQKRMALQSQNLKQLTSKIKVKNLKRTALTDSPGRNQGDGAQAADDTGESPMKNVKAENQPSRPKKRRRENKLINCNELDLTPSQHNYAYLDETTGMLKIRRKKHTLSTKTCDNEQSVRAWCPEDLEKCNISYNSEWISCSPCRILDHLSKKCKIPALTVEQESVLGDLNELLDLDVDSGTLESEGAEETIDNLTKTIGMLEESAREIVENETQETQMMYECMIDWLRVILQMLIGQQTGLSTSREEEVRMVIAFTRCFGLHKQFGINNPKELRVYTTKVTSTPPLRFLIRGGEEGDKVAAIAEIDGNQFPQDLLNNGNQSGQDSQSGQVNQPSQENDMNQSNQIDATSQSNHSDNENQSDHDGGSPKSHDERLFERLAGEMLVEVPDSLYQDCMFGLVFYKTSVVITSLHILREHVRKLQMNLPLSATKHTGKIVYTKLYDLLKSSDRLEVMRFLTRLSKGPNPEEMGKEKETRTIKEEKTVVDGDKVEKKRVDKTSHKAKTGRDKTISDNHRKSNDTKLTTVENLGIYYARRMPGSEPVQSHTDSYSREPNPTEKCDIADTEEGDITDTDKDTGWKGDDETYVVVLEDVSGNDETSGISVTENTDNGNNENSSYITTEMSDDVVLLEEVPGTDDIEMYEETALMDGVQGSEEGEVKTAVGALESVQDWGEIMS